MLVVVLAVCAAVLDLVPATSRRPPDPNLVLNGTFDTDLHGWTAGEDTLLARSGEAHRGSSSAVLRTPQADRDVALDDSSDGVTSAGHAATYAASAWVRAGAAGLTGELRVRESNPGGEVAVSVAPFHLTSTAWTPVRLSFSSVAPGDTLDLSVRAWRLAAGQRLFVDDVVLTTSGRGGAEASSAGSPDPLVATLSNGVGISARGIPASGALVGASVGGNTDPGSFEDELGRRLGVRRTYWGPQDVDRAVQTAREDLAVGRLPWVSFKLPYSWAAMADGAGDAWTTDLAVKLSRLPGPVWVAFHHEPETHGPIRDWTRMQERLGPILRQNAPNAAFTVILTGYQQLFGDGEYALDRLWPRTTVDVVGFDVYNFFGTTTTSGEVVSRPSDLRRRYFEPLGRWAAARGVRWGLAETGINDAAAQEFPPLLQQTYDAVVDNGGIAFTYFDSTLNSSSSWSITTPDKLQQFRSVLNGSPMVPAFV